ncbi:MAG TPA: addiction module protein [Rhodanobacteraceae bacterium]|nr:addiction module protein [Rhodanobacteraceae bacterium]
MSKRAEMDSPAWHGDELVRREQALFAGHESVEDWEAAKRRIRDILA